VLCQNCTINGQVCTNQACVQAPCNAQTCAKGCCQGGACQAGQSDQACGTKGAACTDCSANGLICLNGFCTQ
jgi:hypothetical protein